MLVPGRLVLLSAAEIAAGNGDLAGVTATTAAMVTIVVGTLVGSAAGRALERVLGPRRASRAS